MELREIAKDDNMTKSGATAWMYVRVLIRWEGGCRPSVLSDFPLLIVLSFWVSCFVVTCPKQALFLYVAAWFVFDLEIISSTFMLGERFRVLC